MAKNQAECKCQAEVLESLAELYLRLNGYFCIRNYLYHLEKAAPNGLRTESDMLAIRMPYQREILADGTVQKNDATFILPPGDARIDCLIAEVKKHEVRFNKRVSEKEGWKLIASAVQMFGVLRPEEFCPDGSGIAIANALHKKVSNATWDEIPTAADEKNTVCVRMPVFALSSAGNAAKRRFISLEHALNFVRDRMRPGENCSPYSRGPGFSPWRGTAGRIIGLLDENRAKETPTVDGLLAHLCVCRAVC